MIIARVPTMLATNKRVVSLLPKLAMITLCVLPTLATTLLVVCLPLSTVTMAVLALLIRAVLLVGALILQFLATTESSVPLMLVIPKSDAPTLLLSAPLAMLVSRAPATKVLERARTLLYPIAQSVLLLPLLTVLKMAPFVLLTCATPQMEHANPILP